MIYKIKIFLAWMIAISLLVGLPVGGIYVFNYNYEELTIVVQEKERVIDSSGSNYLVWTEEGEVFKVSDALFRWEFNASDRYGKLTEGNTYNITVVGLRVNIFSWYRNIVKIERLD